MTEKLLSLLFEHDLLRSRKLPTLRLTRDVKFIGFPAHFALLPIRCIDPPTAQVTLTFPDIFQQWEKVV